MAQNRVSMALAALLIAGSAEVAFAQATVNGRFVVPVDAFADLADPDNISVKGIGVRSLGGRLLAQTLKRAVPTSALPPGVPVHQSQGPGGQKTVGFNV